MTDQRKVNRQDVAGTIQMLEKQIYQLKKRVFEWDWKDAEKEKPECNEGVLVFIPEEDNHITSGMWDISGKWVLLDEYREPTVPVTHWMKMPPEPKTTQHTLIPNSYAPSKFRRSHGNKEARKHDR